MVETIKFFEEAYGKRPTVKWSPHKSRQSTIEKRMLRLLKRFKSFYVDTGEEILFVDGGNWVHKANEDGLYKKGLIGHAKNIFPFTRGSKMIQWGSWDNEELKEVKPKRKRRR